MKSRPPLLPRYTNDVRKLLSWPAFFLIIIASLGIDTAYYGYRVLFRCQTEGRVPVKKDPQLKTSLADDISRLSSLLSQTDVDDAVAKELRSHWIAAGFSTLLTETSPDWIGMERKGQKGEATITLIAAPFFKLSKENTAATLGALNEVGKLLKDLPLNQNLVFAAHTNPKEVESVPASFLQRPKDAVFLLSGIYPESRDDEGRLRLHLYSDLGARGFSNVVSSLFSMYSTYPLTCVKCLLPNLNPPPMNGRLVQFLKGRKAVALFKEEQGTPLDYEKLADFTTGLAKTVQVLAQVEERNLP